MNLLIERGAGVFDAVIAGGKSRLRPVLMTSFTTIPVSYTHLSVMAVAPMSVGKEILPYSSIVMMFLSSFIAVLFRCV